MKSPLSLFRRKKDNNRRAQGEIEHRVYIIGATTPEDESKIARKFDEPTQDGFRVTIVEPLAERRDGPISTPPRSSTPESRTPTTPAASATTRTTSTPPPSQFTPFKSLEDSKFRPSTSSDVFKPESVDTNVMTMKTVTSRYPDGTHKKERIEEYTEEKENGRYFEITKIMTTERNGENTFYQKVKEIIPSEDGKTRIHTTITTTDAKGNHSTQKSTEVIDNLDFSPHTSAFSEVMDENNADQSDGSQRVSTSPEALYSSGDDASEYTDGSCTYDDSTMAYTY